MKTQPTAPGFKRCSCSPEPLPVSAFGKNRHRSDNLQARCKTCTNARNAARRATLAETTPRLRRWTRPALDPEALCELAVGRYELPESEVGTVLGFAAVLRRVVQDPEHPQYRAAYEQVAMRKETRE